MKKQKNTLIEYKIRIGFKYVTDGGYFDHKNKSYKIKYRNLDS